MGGKVRGTISRFLPTILVVGCVLWAGLFALVFVGNLVFLSGAESAEATVVGIIEERDRDNDSDGTIKYRARMEFVTAEGEIVSFESRSSKFLPKEIGERIDVLFDPDKPDQAVVDTFEERWYLVMLIGGFGLIFGLITAYVVYKARKAQRNEPSSFEPEHIDEPGETIGLARPTDTLKPADDGTTNYLIDPVSEDTD